jgi:hypothetical protein
VNWLGGNTLVFEQRLGPEQLAYLNQFGTRVEMGPGRTQPPFIYPNRAALPRARLVDQWCSTSELRPELPEKDVLDHFLDGLQDGSIPYRQVVHLDEAPDPVPEGGETPLPEPVFLEDGLDEVIIRVETPRPALLLLADMDAPGWKVEVDGEEKPLLTADLVLRAVALEPGTHEVRFHYSNPIVARGLAISLLGLVVTLALIVWPTVRQRIGSTPPTEEVNDV